MRRIAFFACCAALAVACVSGNDSKNGVKVAALDDSAWKCSEWIAAANAKVVPLDDKDAYRSADGSSWFLTTVVNEKKVTKATWMSAGLGVFDLFLNGERVGEEVLKPGFTHYQKTKLSFTYDITDAFNKAKGKENVLSAQLTPGWWADRILGGEQMRGYKCAFRSVLELEYADGSRALIGTNTEKWKAGVAGPVTHAGIFDGEEYDARILPGWETPEKLSTPEIYNVFEGEILPSEGAEVYRREDLALSPIKAYVWEEIEGAVRPDGVDDDDDSVQHGTIKVKREYKAGEVMKIEAGESLVLDFGQNAAAVPAFVFSAPEGTVLIGLPSEILNDGNGAESRGMDGPEGSVHRRNLRCDEDWIRLVYTFGNKGNKTYYSPRCSFFGYRYLSLSADGPVTFYSIESVPVTSIARKLETGKIETGDELINKLISNTYWGQLSNYLSVPTDCPQRDERLGWTADTQVFTETGTFFANTDRFFHKWMRDMRDSQGPLGGFPGVAPFAQYGNEKMRLGWADAGIIVPWTIWKQYGDNSIVEENWDSMLKFMNHINDTKYNHASLVSENGNYQWADWLSYEALESSGGGAFKTAEIRRDAEVYWNYLGASYWAIDAGMMADMARSTGRDAAPFQKMQEDAKAYIKQNFINEDGTFKLEVLNTMQTPALFALKNGIVEGAAKEAVCARLRKNFEEHGNCLQTGFLGTSILMPTLSDNGMSDIAYELLFQRKNPSWLYSIDNGATTIWERWNSYTIEGGMGPRGMNSFNHYAYGAVCQWIWEYAAGISTDIASPGFKHIILKPVPSKRLGSIKASYESASGLITSEWKYEGEKWVWNFSIPKGCTASVTAPGESEATLYKEGSYTIVNE